MSGAPTSPITSSSRMGWGVQRLLAAIFICSQIVVRAEAISGGAREMPDANSEPEIMYVGSQGTFCSGTLIARDLVLTAAHCIHAGEMYKLVEKGSDRQPVFRDVTTVAHHPQFSLKSMLAHRATADVALMKLAAPLNRLVAPLLPPRPRVTPGESFVVRGYGTSVLGDGNSGGRLREASLIATGQPGNLQLRLVDGASSSTRPGMGACTGDSGAPVYQRTSAGLAIVGVVSWSTAPKNEDGCGGLTGVTPLELYRTWIAGQAARMGSSLAR